jgi:hypothetical protein
MWQMRVRGSLRVKGALMRRPRLVAAVVVAVVVGVVSVLGGPGIAVSRGSASATARAAQPRVTAIGDSVMTAILWYDAAQSVLADGVDLHMEVEVCRRITEQSCPFEGVRPPTLLEVVAAQGPNLGPTVIVEVGYSDPEEVFARGVEETVAALLRSGVTRILWVNYCERTNALTNMNRVLVAAAGRHPQLTIVDWASYSRDHWGWFQTDGIHLTLEGGVGLATLLHTALLRVFAPPLAFVSRKLPDAHAGRTFAARLRAAGGVRPYRWRVTSGPLPRGLHLRSDGLIYGVPVSTARVGLVFHVEDAAGQFLTRRIRLEIDA